MTYTADRTAGMARRCASNTSRDRWGASRTRAVACTEPHIGFSLTAPNLAVPRAPARPANETITMVLRKHTVFIHLAHAAHVCPCCARPQRRAKLTAAGDTELGGAVITEAGTHPNVAALVYVCAFAPDKGESVGSLIAGFPADGPQPPILPPRDGFLFLDRDKFHASFAADLPADVAAFMADSQVPWGVQATAETIASPAWRTKPSWYLVTTEDRMIPPPAQHTMAARIGATVSEAAAGAADR